MAIRVSLKNTFLTFSCPEEDAAACEVSEAPSPGGLRPGKAASPRSRSLECRSPGVRSPERTEEDLNPQIQRLNQWFEEVGSIGSGAASHATASPKLPLTPRSVSAHDAGVAASSTGPSPEDLEHLTSKLEKFGRRSNPHKFSSEESSSNFLHRALSSNSLMSSASSGGIHENANFDPTDGQELEFDMTIEEMPDAKVSTPAPRDRLAQAQMANNLQASADANGAADAWRLKMFAEAAAAAVPPAPMAVGLVKGGAKLRNGRMGKESMTATPPDEACRGYASSNSDNWSWLNTANVDDDMQADAGAKGSGSGSGKSSRKGSPKGGSSPKGSHASLPKAAVGSHAGKDYRHGHVPKTIDLAEESKNNVRTDEPPTTVMIRNIPNRYMQRDLIAELEDLGFASTFDFVYIPLDKGTMSNVGYAFVNFVHPCHAHRCMQRMQRYHFQRYRKTSGRVASASIAHIQGLEANLAHYENAAVNNAKLKQFRPIVIANISKTLLDSISQ